MALSSCGGGGGGGGSGTPALPVSIATLLPWTWIGGSSSYNQQTANSPEARMSSATWTDTSGNFWMFGGETVYTYDINDLWKYNPNTQIWTLESLSSPLNQNQPGLYGTQNTPSTNNLPGARNDSVSWTDPAGNLWLFGGYGYASSNSPGDLNDLWEYAPAAKTWTWVGGSTQTNQFGSYSSTEIPGARLASVSWTDQSGNLWLFGGQGYATSGSPGELNDLWKYNPTTKTWVWIRGSSSTNQLSTLSGTAASPGARHDSVAWTDSTGNLWLFGGQGYAASGSLGELNDLWKFTPGTAQWTLIGSGNFLNQTGSYGTSQTSSPTNLPGSRDSSVAWTDTSGNLWLFGGYGYDSTGTLGELNDLWKFNLGTQQWTWVNGSNQVNQLGSYGSQPGTPGMPGARSSANAWFSSTIGTSGSLWLFGGLEGSGNYLNDLWQYKP
ncbi:kelch repeat-containing protein [Ferrovum sp.]|uniref:Kelch repeat-containing protein n=1 Tax=Ferrovum sp. TaxID=2609467 RepID=UPI00262C6312|nr:kelch repeat-containing protein [Ferrovum sp.]